MRNTFRRLFLLNALYLLRRPQPQNVTLDLGYSLMINYKHFQSKYRESQRVQINKIEFVKLTHSPWKNGVAANKNYCHYNPGHNILALFNNLHRSEWPQVKRYLIFSITNLVRELPHKLPNDLRLRISGNQEILEKCQIWVEMQASAQSSFQKLNFDNSCQKTRKIR